jgi:hypothetical protein
MSVDWEKYLSSIKITQNGKLLQINLAQLTAANASAGLSANFAIGSDKEVGQSWVNAVSLIPALLLQLQKVSAQVAEVKSQLATVNQQLGIVADDQLAFKEFQDIFKEVTDSSVYVEEKSDIQQSN